MTNQQMTIEQRRTQYVEDMLPVTSMSVCEAIKLSFSLFLRRS